MTNLIKNSSGLDGGLHWLGLDGGSGADVTADESVLGSPGRAVIRTVDPVNYLQTEDIYGLTAGDRLTVFAHHTPGSRLGIAINAGGDWLPSTVYPVLQDPGGSGKRGIPSTFAFSKGVSVMPSGTSHAVVFVYDPAGPAALAVLKPFMGEGDVCRWSPGPHSNPDLILPVWPESLPHVLEIDAPRTRTRVEYVTDSDVPITRRVTRTPRTRFSGVLALDLEQRDVLEQFFLSGAEPFLFVNPASDELCRAWWSEDGEPSDSGRGPARRTSIGLILEVL